jgi:CHAT domain-containing protein
MDKQRLQAYLDLIEALLLTYASGEENVELNAHLDLVDMGLVAEMERVEAHMLAEGHTNLAELLRDWIPQLTAFMPIQFWQSLVKTAVDVTKDNDDVTERIIAESVYCLMRNNLDQVDNSLAKAMVHWVEENLVQRPQDAENTLELLELFCNYIREFPYGKFREVNEIALAGYNFVLDHLEDDPRRYAETLASRGVAYKNLAQIGVDGLTNLRLAIADYGKAVVMREKEGLTRELFPTLNNRGVAYRNLAQMGVDVVTNLRLAITDFDRAEIIFEKEDVTLSIFYTLTNRGSAYLFLAQIDVDGETNLCLAIADYDRAVAILKDENQAQELASTLTNRGSAHLSLAQMGVDIESNHSLAIADYDEAVVIFKAKRCVRDILKTLINRGKAFASLAQVNDEPDLNYGRALKDYRNVLKFITPKTLPSDCLLASRYLGDLGFEHGNWEIAVEGYSLAIEAIEQTRAWSSEERHREKVQAQAIKVYTNIVQALIQLHRYPEALQYAERSRSKRLSDLMRVNDFYQKGEIPIEIRAKLDEYNALQRQIDAIYHKLDSSQQSLTLDTLRPSISVIDQQRIAEIEAQQTKVWQELRHKDPLAAAGKRVSHLEIDEIGQLLGNSTSTALLSFFSTDSDTFIFIVRRNSEKQIQITTHQCRGQGFDTLQTWIFEKWIKPYRHDYDKWAQQITTFLENCRNRLDLNTLIEDHFDDTITELILIPHLYLHQIPFAAIPLTPDGDKSQFFGERFTIRYAPSCEILKICSDRPSLNAPSNYGIIEGASLDVPYAAFQGEEIATLLNIPPTQRLRGPEASTISNFKQLVQTVNILHCYHHASSNANEPLKSSLALADGYITLAQLLVWQLTELQEVFLSCCETAFGISQSFTDEVFTLASGFLCAGARTVIGTLWSVEQLSAALLCIFYYKHREKGLDRPHALQSAQQQLRQLSGTTLENEYGDHLETVLEVHRQLLHRSHEIEQVKGETAAQDSFCRLKAIEDIIKNLPRHYAQTRPFAAPVYWAAFTCQGLP